ncbi:MAG: aminopeptidase P family protein [Lachnospiraceae bacterium]|nr:aminopeptidase P family protein [Lachnospiraceae bacterium]
MQVENLNPHDLTKENVHPLRLNALREKMTAEGIDFFLIPTADFHQSEYVAPYFKTRAFFSGFTGSSGTLLVGRENDFAGLWTDGRYFTQAEKELTGSGVELFRMQEKDVPTIEEFLKDHLKEGGVLGFDGRCLSAKQAQTIKEKIGHAVTFRSELDPADGIWTGRPARPAGPVLLLDEEKIAGETAVSKLQRLRAEMEKEGVAYFVSSKLDDIAWLLNIRGTDIECNPVVLSHIFVDKDGFALFLQDVDVDDRLPAHIEAAGGEIRSYDGFVSYLEGRDYPDGKVLLDRAGTSYQVADVLQKKTGDAEDAIVDKLSPLAHMKAIKNETEMKNARAAYLDDSVALTKFIYWMRMRAEKAARDGDEYLTDPIDTFAVDGEDSLGAYLNEYTAAMRLDDMRRQIPDFVELSFPTISAYGANAAMAHYEATQKDHADLKPSGMYLVDSGGQYLRGTTDVTRTIALGPVTEEMRRHYTLTLAGTLRLQNAVFLEGCTGRNLDILARMELWKDGVDYKHGTGHGIGALLNVHEGPQRISWQKMTPDEEMKAGMIVSDEPGVYREGEYGIRIETILLTVNKCESADGKFLGFDALTYVPLDKRLIDRSLLPSDVLKMLDEYQQAVFEKLSPYLSEEERAWLKEETTAE